MFQCGEQQALKKTKIKIERTKGWLQFSEKINICNACNAERLEN